MDKSRCLAKGSFSVVYKAVDVVTGTDVAVKVYIDQSEVNRENVLKRFERQVQVLGRLSGSVMIPSELPEEDLDTSFTLPLGLSSAKPKFINYNELFIQMLDHSKDANGQPGPWTDGNFYIVLELAKLTLEEHLNERRKTKNPLTRLDFCCRGSILVFQIGDNIYIWHYDRYFNRITC
jgi:serine/threonine protein kinase